MTPSFGLTWVFKYTVEKSLPEKKTQKNALWLPRFQTFVSVHRLKLIRIIVSLYTLYPVFLKQKKREPNE